MWNAMAPVNIKGFLSFYLITSLCFCIFISNNPKNVFSLSNSSIPNGTYIPHFSTDLCIMKICMFLLFFNIGKIPIKHLWLLDSFSVLFFGYDNLIFKFRMWLIMSFNTSPLLYCNEYLRNENFLLYYLYGRALPF